MNQEVKIIYKNWKGVTSTRTIFPQEIWFGHTQWHPADQWFLAAIDLDKNEPRDFALCDIISWVKNEA